MDAKEQLKDMINHIIQGNTEEAAKSFHPYLQSKMASLYTKKSDTKDFSELPVTDDTINAGEPTIPEAPVAEAPVIAAE